MYAPWLNGKRSGCFVYLTIHQISCQIVQSEFSIEFHMVRKILDKEVGMPAF